MKDFADVTPTEKKREARIRKEGKLEKEPTQRRKRKEAVREEAVQTTGEASKPVEAVPEKPAVKETEVVEPKEPSKKEAKIKQIKKPKPVEKIKYSGKREVAGLKLRKKKPKFRRQEHYKKRLDLVWRKPIGIDSKQHEGKRGKGKKPNIGYKNPDAIRGLHPLGYRPVLIHNVKELLKINPAEEGAIIASAVGRRKRNLIIAGANKLKINILNPRKGEL